MVQRDDDLRDSLRGELRTALAEMRKSGADVSPALAQRIERLARLVQVEQLARETPGRRRWPLSVVLLTTLVLMSVLLFARVQETEIVSVHAAQAT